MYLFCNNSSVNSDIGFYITESLSEYSQSINALYILVWTLYCGLRFLSLDGFRSLNKTRMLLCFNTVLMTTDVFFSDECLLDNSMPFIVSMFSLTNDVSSVSSAFERYELFLEAGFSTWWKAYSTIALTENIFDNPQQWSIAAKSIVHAKILLALVLIVP